ncbi:MAG: glycerol transport system ATP-binding protein [Chitinophagales bacterium]|jgi:glycerol transport system ATP-binding protein
MSLTFNNVSRVVNGVAHINDVSMSFSAGSFNVLLGRTLSGKTSLMRLMAGLDKPDSGQILMHGDDLSDVPVQRRNVSMVYQQFINYPHLSVFDNIASPLRVARKPASVINRKVKEIASLLHIDEFLTRMPLDLSGGQQQRTAMARALVKDASLILFDEPLVNLDYKLREELRTELRELFKESKTVVVYATTEPGEALALGGVTSLLHQGKMIQSGAAHEVYTQPDNMIAAELFSEPSLNMLEASDYQHPVGKLLAIRPEHVALSAYQDNDLKLELIVDVAEISGSETFLHMRKQGQHQQEIIARLRGVHHHQSGDLVTVYFPQSKLFCFDADGNTLVNNSKKGQRKANNARSKVSTVAISENSSEAKING